MDVKLARIALARELTANLLLHPHFHALRRRVRAPRMVARLTILRDLATVPPKSVRHIMRFLAVVRLLV